MKSRQDKTAFARKSKKLKKSHHAVKKLLKTSNLQKPPFFSEQQMITFTKQILSFIYVETLLLFYLRLA